MNASGRAAAAPTATILVVVFAANLVAGLHYATADGGFVTRTHANHLGGWIHLVTAAVVLAASCVLLRRPITTWRLLAAVLAILVLAIGGFVAGQSEITSGLTCACEGG